MVGKKQASVFELEFEICYALFIGTRSDGKITTTQLKFLEAAFRSLDWSKSYAKMLEDRVARLPEFSFYDFKLARKEPTFAELLKELFLIMLELEGSENTTHMFEQFSQIVLEETPNLKKLKTNKKELHQKKSKKENKEPEKTLQEHQAELEELIGLDSVKKQVQELIHLIEIQNHRKSHKMQSPEMSLHMVFTGNPGTGKTTVARIFSKTLKAMGILKKGHLIETDRSGLVGQHIGHTEVKTNQVVDEALDGILFIDEAYALFRESSGSDFGKEAIDALVKRIEDDRDRLIVIVAGYKEEMDTFITANPGLKSRFNTFIDFPDYKLEELLAIFDLLSQSNDYTLTAGAREILSAQMKEDLSKKENGFGNGRYVRNLFEKAVRKQAVRLNSTKKTLSRRQLTNITKKDLN